MYQLDTFKLPGRSAKSKSDAPDQRGGTKYELYSLFCPWNLPTRTKIYRSLRLFATRGRARASQNGNL